MNEAGKAQKVNSPFPKSTNGEWWELGETGGFMLHLKRAADSQLEWVVVVKEGRPSVARNLDFYVSDPKWLSVPTASTVWTNTSAGQPKQACEPNSPCRCWSRVLEAHGWVVSWVRALKSEAVSGSRWFSAVGLSPSLPLLRKRLS